MSDLDEHLAGESYPWPLPELAWENTAFWMSGATGRLQLHRCQACELWIHPPSPVCRRCFSNDVSPEPVAGTGVVHTYTVNYQPWLPGVDVPYVIAVVELDEQPGLRLTTRLEGDNAVSDVAIGKRVSVVFAPAGQVWVPLFALGTRGDDACL